MYIGLNYNSDPNIVDLEALMAIFKGPGVRREEHVHKAGQVAIDVHLDSEDGRPFSQ